MSNEKPAARARRLAGVAWAAYAAELHGHDLRLQWEDDFTAMFVRGYEDAVRDMVDVDDERGG